MRTSNSRLAAAALIAALCGAPVAAQNYRSLTNPAPAEYLSERQAVAFFETVDQSEKEAAQLALVRSKNEDVLAYARQLLADHEDFGRRLAETGVAGSGSEDRRRMEDRSRMTISRLKRLDGPAFDRAYIGAQIENHEKVLDKIDHRIAGQAKTGPFAAHVQDRRPLIESHLEHARRIKMRLGTR